MDSGYILNRRPYRDNSLLVDLITEHAGLITCVARYAKKRGKIMKGTLEPFRFLRLDWIGRGEVQTLTLADEQGRHKLHAEMLCHALYFNELVLKLFPRHVPDEEVFKCYQRSLYQLSGQDSALLACELDLLATLGYDLQEVTYSHPQLHLDADAHYRFSDLGLQEDHELPPHMQAGHAPGVPISGRLLIKLGESSTLEASDEQELRQFLDRFFDVLLAGKKLNSRKLAFGHK